MQAINHFFLERGEETLHTRIIKATVCASHALSDRAVLVNQLAILPAGVLAAMVGMQNEILLVPVAGDRITERCAAQAGMHVRLHGESDDHTIETVHNCGKIEFPICAFDLRNIAEIFHPRRWSSKVPLYQILTLRRCFIRFRQAVRSFFTHQQMVFLA